MKRLLKLMTDMSPSEYKKFMQEHSERINQSINQSMDRMMETSSAIVVNYSIICFNRRKNNYTILISKFEHNSKRDGNQ